MIKWLRDNPLLLFVVVSLAIYLPTYNYGMVSDYLGWVKKYEAGSWSDIWNCFGYAGLHQVHHFFHYTLYALIGTNHFIYYLVFAALHGYNTYLVFRVFSACANGLMTKPSKAAPWIACILFLVSPYQVEPVTWKACMHYLISMALLLASLKCFVEWLKSNDTSKLVGHLLLWIIGIFTLEIHFATPIICTVYMMVYYRVHREKNRWSNWAVLISIYGIFFAIYFLLNTWILGDIVGHYGADSHLVSSPDIVFPNAVRYLMKYGFLVHYLNYDVKHSFYQLAELPWFYMAVLGGLLLSGFMLWWFRKGKHGLLVFAGVSFFIGLLPIVNLYFVDIVPYENDRYGYIASAFLYLGIGVIIDYFKGKLKIAIAGVVILIHVILLSGMIRDAHNAGKVYHHLLDTFRWEKEDRVFLLASPENYKGMYLFRNYDGLGTSLRHALIYLKEKEAPDFIKDVAQFNMKNPSDRIDINIEENGEWKAAIAQGGTWFWRKGIGLGNYESDYYKVEVQGWFYTTDWKSNYPREGIALTCSEDGWKELSGN